MVLDAEKPITVKTYLPDDAEAEDKIKKAEEAVWHLSLLRQIEPLRVVTASGGGLGRGVEGVLLRPEDWVAGLS